MKWLINKIKRYFGLEVPLEVGDKIKWLNSDNAPLISRVIRKRGKEVSTASGFELSEDYFMKPMSGEPANGLHYPVKLCERRSDA